MPKLHKPTKQRYARKSIMKQIKRRRSSQICEMQQPSDTNFIWHLQTTKTMEFITTRADRQQVGKETLRV